MHFTKLTLCAIIITSISQAYGSEGPAYFNKCAYIASLYPGFKALSHPLVPHIELAMDKCNRKEKLTQYLDDEAKAGNTVSYLGLYNLRKEIKEIYDNLHNKMAEYEIKKK